MMPKVIKSDEDEGEGEDEGEDQPTKEPKGKGKGKAIDPEKDYLVANNKGILKLGPLPDGGLHADVASALHSYISQKWSE